jgi:ABC-2 type transport system permease protein
MPRSHRSRAIVRQDLRVLRSDPVFLIVIIVMPLVVMAFLKPAFRGVLVLDGVEGATGAEQVVPGTSVIFALFLVGNLGFAVFREHGWNTWERLRASRASTVQVMVGKSVVPFLSIGFQQVILLGVGSIVFDLNVRGSGWALAAVAVAFALSLLGLSYVLLAFCRTVMQLNGISQIGTMVMAGLGGALAPASSLPGWAQAIAPLFPSYWAMRGYRSTILDGGGFSAVALPCAVLVGFAVAYSLVAWHRFRFEETKISWA